MTLSLTNHLITLPILLPLICGGIMLLTTQDRPALQKKLGGLSLALQLLVSLRLLMLADQGQVISYQMGNWPTPFGINLLLDRLSAMMLVLTALLASASLLFTWHRTLSLNRFYPALFQFQLMGIHGAFLTGDLFNLFVFFEILLLASYALLLEGGGRERTASASHYVVLNLLGSAFFLIAAALIYNTTGTLNIADLSNKMLLIPPDKQPLFQAACWLLLVVFLLKSAAFPIHSWLPRTYAAAIAPVAALFAIMSKVGIYAIIRFNELIFKQLPNDNFLPTLLLILGTAGMLYAAIGLLGSRSLRQIAAWHLILSIGTLSLGLSLGSAAGLSATLFYLLHSTWSIGAVFLLAGLLTLHRGEAGDQLAAAHQASSPASWGLLFIAAATAAAGLPPLAGFFSKLLLLQAAMASSQQPLIWGTLLAAGLVTLIVYARAGSALFLRSSAASSETQNADTAGKASASAVLLLLLLSLALAIGGGSATRYTAATAAQLMARTPYLEAVALAPEIRQSDRVLP